MASRSSPPETLPAPETTSEEAPLLDSSDTYDEPAPEPRPQLKKPVLICTWLCLVLAVITWPFIAVVKVFLTNQPIDFHTGWAIEDDLNGILGLSIAAFVFALANLVRLRWWKKLLPLFINLIVDYILAFYLIVVSANGIRDATEGSCYRSRYPYPNPTPPIDPPPIPQRCYDFLYVVMVLEECAMSLGLVIGVTSLVLAVLTTILVYRSKFWRGWVMRFPTGTFTIEFTVKLLRQEDQNAPSAQPARQ